jgi:hypothetical protein
MGTVAEIEAALAKLTPEQQREVADWLESRLMPESPAMLAALDVGIRSFAEEPATSAGDLRRKIQGWTTR